MKRDIIVTDGKRCQNAGELIIGGVRLKTRPKHWDSNLNIDSLDLTDLHGCPKFIQGDFSCSFNSLESLEGGPENIDGSFSCGFNRLTSLKGGPTVVSDYYNCRNNYLTSLIGAPTHLYNGLGCEYNQIHSLEGCPKIIFDEANFLNNKLTNLHDIHKHISVCAKLDFSQNQIESHILGLIKIKNLENVTFSDFPKAKELTGIVNKHLKNRDIFAFQDELMAAGFEEYAQL
jgi:Leucine-rich repeat (LRR) protein